MTDHSQIVRAWVLSETGKAPPSEEMIALLLGCLGVARLDRTEWVRQFTAAIGAFPVPDQSIAMLLQWLDADHAG